MAKSEAEGLITIIIENVTDFPFLYSELLEESDFDDGILGSMSKKVGDFSYYDLAKLSRSLYLLWRTQASINLANLSYSKRPNSWKHAFFISKILFCCNSYKKAFPLIDMASKMYPYKYDLLALRGIIKHSLHGLDIKPFDKRLINYQRLFCASQEIFTRLGPFYKWD